MTHIELKHPITHNELHYDRGVYEIGKTIDQAIAELFLKLEDSEGKPLNVAVPFEFKAPVAAQPIPAVDSRKATVNSATHNLNVAQVTEMVASESDLDILNGLLDGEKAHPNYTNGRKAVIAAIEQRIAAVKG